MKDKELGNIIFDINDTGMPYYNSMIQKGHIVGNRDPVEYFKNHKNIVFEIEWMSPVEYLEKSYEIHIEITETYGGELMSFERYIEDNIQFEDVAKYKERTLKGSKMPIPILDYNNLSQEGRHRSIVAKELGAEKIPVLVVRTYNE